MTFCFSFLQNVDSSQLLLSLCTNLGLLGLASKAQTLKISFVPFNGELN